jgi:hypothetical protein
MSAEQYSITINDPRGFPSTIVNDFERAEFQEVERCWMEWDESEQLVTISAEDDNAAKALYDWLEETRQHYRENYVDASGDHDAAEQMAREVYDALSQ